MQHNFTKSFDSTTKNLLAFVLLGVFLLAYARTKKQIWLYAMAVAGIGVLIESYEIWFGLSGRLDENETINFGAVFCEKGMDKCENNQSIKGVGTETGVYKIKNGVNAYIDDTGVVRAYSPVSRAIGGVKPINASQLNEEEHEALKELFTFF